MLNNYKRQKHILLDNPEIYGNLLFSVSKEYFEDGKNELQNSCDYELEKLLKNDKIFNHNLANKYYPYKLHTYIFNKNWEDGSDYIRKNKILFKELDSKLIPSSLLVIYGNCAVICYFIEDFVSALKHINSALDTGSKHMIFYSNFLEILWLLIQFEKEEFDLIEYRLPSALKRIQSRKEIVGYEKLFISGFRKIVRNPNKENQLQELLKIKSQISALSNQQFQAISNTFNLVSWIDKMIGRITT
ncbi:MAG: hypothetical protein ACK40M_02825 [Flavobacteriales bacterium]